MSRGGCRQGGLGGQARARTASRRCLPVRRGAWRCERQCQPAAGGARREHGLEPPCRGAPALPPGCPPLEPTPCAQPTRPSNHVKPMASPRQPRPRAVVLQHRLDVLLGRGARDLGQEELLGGWRWVGGLWGWVVGGRVGGQQGRAGRRARQRVILARKSCGAGRGKGSAIRGQPAIEQQQEPASKEPRWVSAGAMPTRVLGACKEGAVPAELYPGAV